MPRVRLVVATAVGEPARAALARSVEPLAERYPVLRWAAPEDWCVEVCALDAIEADRAPEVDEVVAEAANAQPQIALRLDGGAGIDDTATGLFVGVAGSEGLVGLRGAVIRRLDARKLPVGCAGFLPHCVIGCTSGGARVPLALAHEFRGPTVTWTVKQLLVVRTRLRLGGIAREVRSAHDLVPPVASSA